MGDSIIRDPTPSYIASIPAISRTLPTKNLSIDFDARIVDTDEYCACCDTKASRLFLNHWAHASKNPPRGGFSDSH